MSSILRQTFPSLLSKTLCRQKYIATLTKTCVRTIGMLHFNKKKWTRYKIKDQIPEGFEMIYLEKSTIVPLLSFPLATITCVALIFGAWSFFNYYDLETVDEKFRMRMARTKTQAAFFFILSFLICLAARQFSRKVPFRIYHNSEKKLYKIVSAGYIPFRQIVNECQEGSIISRKFSLYRALNLGQEYTANKKHYILEYRNFQTPADMFKFIGGYDESGLDDEN